MGKKHQARKARGKKLLNSKAKAAAALRKGGGVHKGGPAKKAGKPAQGKSPKKANAKKPRGDDDSTSDEEVLGLVESAPGKGAARTRAPSLKDSYRSDQKILLVGEVSAQCLVICVLRSPNHHRRSQRLMLSSAGCALSGPLDSHAHPVPLLFLYRATSLSHLHLQRILATRVVVG